MSSVDHAQLCQLLDCFLSQRNSVRQQAEAAFNNLKQSNPDGLIRALLAILREDPKSYVRQQAAVSVRTVLRDFILHRSDFVWTQLTAETKQILKSELLNSLEAEPIKSVWRSVCDTVADLAAELSVAGEWPELNSRLMQLVESSKTTCQAAGLKILGDLVPQLSELIRNNTAGVARIVAACAKSEDADVRYETLCLITSLVQSEPRSVWKHMQAAVPDIIAGLQALLVEESEDLAVCVIYSIYFHHQLHTSDPRMMEFTFCSSVAFQGFFDEACRNC